MASQRRMSCANISIGTNPAISTLSQAGAQWQSKGRGGRPAAGAKGLRPVLFNWTWYTGMLHGVDERELITSLEYRSNEIKYEVTVDNPEVFVEPWVMTP